MISRISLVKILPRRTELWDLNANGRVRAAWYNGDDDLDTVDMPSVPP